MPNIKENLINRYGSILLTIFINTILIYILIPNTTYLVPLTSFLTIVIYFIYALYKTIKEKKEFKECLYLESITVETERYRESIKDIWQTTFKKGDYQEIFNKKIFVMIDFLVEMNEDNMRGTNKFRIKKLINASLKLYIVNLRSAEKMIRASKIDIDFKEEIEELLRQNKSILLKLKEFITKIIVIDISNKEFSNLISEFENSLKNLEIIKDIKENNL